MSTAGCFLFQPPGLFSPRAEKGNSLAKLIEENRTTLNDQIGCAYAILRHGHVISSKEALNLLSLIRLGCDLGYFPQENRSLVDLLLMENQPAHLQIEAKKKLSPEERDILRAEMTRRKLKILPVPLSLIM